MVPSHQTWSLPNRVPKNKNNSTVPKVAFTSPNFRERQRNRSHSIRWEGRNSIACFIMENR